LIKLKFDLKEVIKLTHDLIKSQQQEKRQANGMDAKDPILLAVLANKWKIGDQCMAPWSEDGKWVSYRLSFYDWIDFNWILQQIVYDIAWLYNKCCKNCTFYTSHCYHKLNIKKYSLKIKYCKFCRYYEATIDAISEDGVVNITFNEYKNTDVTMLSQLKSVARRPASDWADQKSK